MIYPSENQTIRYFSVFESQLNKMIHVYDTFRRAQPVVKSCWGENLKNGFLT